jgi:hypothetical protein
LGAGFGVSFFDEGCEGGLHIEPGNALEVVVFNVVSNEVLHIVVPNDTVFNVLQELESFLLWND